MTKVDRIVTGYQSAEARWARFGPYYAMFPLDFAFEIVENYSEKGDFIIDPFAGRCSSIYAGGVLGRHSLGIEINPVGWLYGTAKLNPADKEPVIGRLREVYAKRNYYRNVILKMPAFFRMCYCDEVLKFLLAAQKYLNWEKDSTDATLMSILLVYLHGKIGEGLSNQMQKAKSMGMNYSLAWWKEHKMTRPPQIDPLDFITKKIEWRYEKGKPAVFDSEVVFGDSSLELDKIVNKARQTEIKFSLLFTSPPYYSITDYYADQWLRLWLLGGIDKQLEVNAKHKGRFKSKEEYYNLLDSVFGNCSNIMDRRSTIYVRTDRREFTFNSTLEILIKYFPTHHVEILNRPFIRKTQTEIYGNSSKEAGEIDIILVSK